MTTGDAVLIVTDGRSPMSDDAAVPPPLTARLLGEVELWVGDRLLPNDAWPPRAGRDVLLLLLATPGFVLPKSRLREGLWPGLAPGAVDNALAKALHALRRVLEPGLRPRHPGGYVASAGDAVALHADRCATDADAFEAALAGREVWTDANRLREALRAYRGDLLGEEPAATLAAPRRQALSALHERAVLRLAELDHVAGHPLASVSMLETALAADPANEALHRALIAAFLAAGRRDRAAAQLARCAAALAEETGDRPSQETLALMDGIAAALAKPAPRTLPFRPLPDPDQGVDADALASLVAILDRPGVRLVTVAAPQGAEAAALALVLAAADAANPFRDGVRFLAWSDLACRDDPAIALTQALAATVLAGSNRRSDGLAGAEVLLAIAAVEPSDAAASLLAELVTREPGVTVLATCSERLRLRAEHHVPVLSWRRETGAPC
jgi:DNA-binding SARP family transcriptional activator